MNDGAHEPTGPIGPSEPIELTGHASRWGDASALTDAELEQLRAVCPATVGAADEPDAVAAVSRDWWPLAMRWSLAGQVPRRAAAWCRPTSVEQVAAVVGWCHRQRVPVVAAGGRSGVCGGSVAARGGVILDLTGLAGVTAIDAHSGVVTALAGTFGPDLLDAVAAAGMTIGHEPQSIALSTVGGWVACRGAGQLSTRYGKIEDMVVALQVVLADGRVIRTGGAPAAATGPDLTALFVGSEGTLGVITEVTLRAHPAPSARWLRAATLSSFGAGIELCRQIVRRGATPAVLRLYDPAEAGRGFDGDGSAALLLAMDEGDADLIAGTATVFDRCVEQAASATVAETALVERWLAHRNDTSGLQALTRKGIVIDTMEVAAPWSALDAVVAETTAALLAVPGARLATCHLSHSYLDGACLYFTFAGQPAAETEHESMYVALWDAGQRAALRAGANLSHHHGVGINRARFMAEAMGESMAVLAALKDTLDPHGILNPGKLGLVADGEGSPPWP